MSQPGQTRRFRRFALASIVDGRTGMSKILLALLVPLAACATTPTARVDVTGGVKPTYTRVASTEALSGQAAADVDLCVSPTGQVISAQLARGSQVEAFDRALMTDVLAWEFPVPAAHAEGPWCTRVHVAYSTSRPA
jgi:TonB family protein